MKKAFLLVFLLLLFSIIVVFSFVNQTTDVNQAPDEDSTTDKNMIYIRADGSVKPSTAPLERDGNVYTFKADFNGSIVVEKDNVVIDGAGFTLQGTGASDYRPAIPEINFADWWNQVSELAKYDETILPKSNNTGIYSHAQKLTITNLKITEFWCAIELESSSDNSIVDNEIVNNTGGVWIHSSSNNTISGNTITNVRQGITLTAANNNIYANNITDSAEYGIKLLWSFNNITENRITNSGNVVTFSSSTHNIFRNNIFNENSQIFCATSSSYQEYLQDVDTSNLVNEKPIYYWINRHDLTIPEDAGLVTLINCTRIKVENLNLAYGEKISLISTTNSTITGNALAHNQVCIYLQESSNNIIELNALSDSVHGIQLKGSSSNHIRYNTVTGNTKGIDITSSTKNIIQQNNITGNSQGISMLEATGNTITGNSLTLNEHGIYLGGECLINSENPYNSTMLQTCSDNTFSENNINENIYGAWMRSAENNTFSGNNFLNNTEQLKMDDFLDISGFTNIQTENATIEFSSINFWDDGTEGNFWSSYNGTDSNGDGVGDVPYVLNQNNQDNYPLMSPIVIPEIPDATKQSIPN